MAVTAGQNLPEFMDLRAASTVAYNRGLRARQVRLLGTAVLAAAGPVVVWAISGGSTALTAATGIWLLIDRLLLRELEADGRCLGAALQEKHDTRLFSLSWNGGVAGPRPTEETTHRLARRCKERPRLADWYPDVDGALDGVDILLCQRANVVWARQDHCQYRRLLTAITTGWFVILTLIGIVAGLSSGDAWVHLYLPSVPAFLLAGDVIHAHRRAERAKQGLEEQVEALTLGALDGNPPSSQDLRATQDGLYVTRREAPQVPRTYYRLVVRDREEDMRAAADALVKRLPVSD
jgi:hypothetical protein